MRDGLRILTWLLLAASFAFFGWSFVGYVSFLNNPPSTYSTETSRENLRATDGLPPPVLREQALPFNVPISSLVRQSRYANVYLGIVPPPTAPPFRTIFLSHPELIKPFFEASTADLPIRWGPLLTELGLTAEQKATFLRIKEGQIVDSIEAELDKPATNGPVTDNNLGEREERARLAREQALESLFGRDGVQRYQEYRQMDDARDQVESIAISAGMCDNSLRPDQFVQLVRIINQVNMQSLFSDGNLLVPNDHDYDKMLQEATSFLDSDQLQVVSRYINFRKARLGTAFAMRPE